MKLEQNGNISESGAEDSVVAEKITIKKKPSTLHHRNKDLNVS